VRAVQQRSISTPSDRSRFGVSHPSVVATGPADAPVCHLAPGTWRPGGPDQCYHNRIMSQFDYNDWLASARFPIASDKDRTPPSLPLPTFPLEPPSTGLSYESAQIDLGAIKQLCTAAAAHGNAPVLQLDGLLPIRDILIDAPIGVSEFASEAKRLASGKPRWKSLLQREQLRSLMDACPGAKDFLQQRMACVGYYLAE